MYVDNIRDIIHCLNKDEVKEFKSFINRQRIRKNRKDLELFEVLLEEESYPAKEIVDRLYGGVSKIQMNAYHSIRKRLIKHLMDFIIVKRMDDDTSSTPLIMGQLSLSEYLFDYGNDRLAWNYLKKAEELANSSEQYDLLDNILNLQISKANSKDAPPMEELIEKWKLNKQLADEDERANIANSIIQIKLDEYRLGGKDIELNREVSKVLVDFNLHGAMQTRPKLLYNFLSIVRSSVLARKEYYKFEDVVEENYQRMKQEVGFEKKDHNFHLGILYMICHIKYRVRKFEEALSYLNELNLQLDKYPSPKYRSFVSRGILIKGACLSYLGQNTQAIELLEEALNSGLKHEVEHELDMRLNLCVYYFQSDNFKKANSVLNQFSHTDRWCQKKVGEEWVARKNLIEILTQFELGNVDIAMNWIKNFERNHSDLLALDIYGRIKTFLGFVKDCIDKPYWIASEDYFNYVNKTLERWPLDQEDVQAMAFYCWLKAKMLKKSYYYVLVETVNGRL